MPVTISGNNITVPGYIYLTNPLIGVNRVLAVDPTGAINVTQITVEAIEKLSSLTSESVPNSIVFRDANADFAAHDVTVNKLNAPVVTSLTAGETLTIAARDGDVGGGVGGRLNLYGGSGQGDAAGDGGKVVITGGAGGNNGGNVEISGGSGSVPGQVIINSVAGLQVNGDLLLSGVSYSSGFNLVTGAGVGKINISDGDGNMTWDSSAIRVKSSKLQMKCPDDSLFYDLTIRLVAGVPTLSIEGSGEA